MSEDQARPAKLSIVVFSGEFVKVHYALVMASGAAAIDVPVTLFFTMEGARAIFADQGWKKLAGSETDEEFKARNVAHFEELLEACTLMDVKFMVCEMGLRAMGLENEPIRDDVTVDTGGVATFLYDARKDGSVVFV